MGPKKKKKKRSKSSDSEYQKKRKKKPHQNPHHQVIPTLPHQILILRKLGKISKLSGRKKSKPRKGRKEHQTVIEFRTNNILCCFFSCKELEPVVYFSCFVVDQFVNYVIHNEREVLL